MKRRSGGCFGAGYGSVGVYEAGLWLKGEGSLLEDTGGFEADLSSF